MTITPDIQECGWALALRLTGGHFWVGVLVAIISLVSSSHVVAQTSTQGYNDYLSAKSNYEAALKAQMQRAQLEQGAPKGFAEKAFAATKAYLDSTEEKSYGPGMRQPESTQRTPARHMVQPSRHASFAPPVHVAPTAHSSPPPVRQRPVQAQRSANRNQTSDPRLQDRFEQLISSNSSPEIGSGLKRTGYVAEPRAQRNEKTVSYQQPQRQPQPLFVPDNERLASVVQPQAKAPQNPIVASRAVGYETPTRFNVRPAAMSNPGRPLRLAGPQDFEPISVPQLNQQRTAQPIQQPYANDLPTRSRIPNMVGAQGSYAKPKQISVLMNRADSVPMPPAHQEDAANSFQATPPAQLPLTQQNQERMEKLPQQATPTEDQGTNNGAPQQPSNSAQSNDAQSQFDRQLRNMRDSRGMDDQVDDLRPKRQGEDDADATPEREPLATCEDFRTRLLGSSIRDIALDISPPASRIRDQYVAISRSWTDRNGNIVATGTMVDLRRGYVIIQTNNGLQKIPYAKLSDSDWAAVAQYWRIPELCSVGSAAVVPRAWTPQTVTWHASALCHKPLYFENRQLERYGHTHGPVLQPIHSTAHFFVSLFALPYKTAIHPPTECMYALGYYRPGNCAPWLKDPIPISLDGVRRQALVVSAFAFIP